MTMIMTMKKELFALSCVLALSAFPQDIAAVRAEYQREQALAEVPRLVQQFELLNQNQEEIAQRLVKLEQADHTSALQAEIAALRAEIAELRASIRREQDAVRAEIVRDLAGRIAKMKPPAPPPQPAAQVQTVVISQPAAGKAGASRTPPPPSAATPRRYYEYEVKQGQTLSYIAEGFGTTVGKILAANPKLRVNALRPGQKLIIPIEDEPAAKAPARNTKKRK